MTMPVPASKPQKPTARKGAKAVPTESPKAEKKASTSFSLNKGVSAKAHKIVIYGPGGVGKSELASLLSEVDINPVFIDIERGTSFLDVNRIEPTPESYEELLDAVRAAATMGDAIVIDSLTKAEEMAVSYTLENVTHEKGHYVKSIEGYGFGKGYIHVYESFLLLLQALDAAVRSGVHVVGICHDCTANVPNPQGEDWIRYEPRLQAPPSGKGSIRHRVKEWCDHLLYVGFDSYVTEDGKAQGSGTRTIYPYELPTWWAKSRKLVDHEDYQQGDATVWEKLFN